MEENKTMKERLLDPANKSDIPTITYMTPRAIIFYTAAVAAIVGMFGNWFALDLDLGYFQLNEILGKINPFTMVKGVGEVINSLGVLSAFLPEEVMSALRLLSVVSWMLMILAIGAIVLYAYAAYLRISENDMTAKYGRIASICAAITSCGFAAVVVCLLAALDANDYIGSALGMIASGPCMVTLVAAVAAGCCAVLDMGFKEDVVIYHNGVLKIDRGPKWKCACCGRKNLSLLEKCYYCGKDK